MKDIMCVSLMSFSAKSATLVDVAIADDMC